MAFHGARPIDREAPGAEALAEDVSVDEASKDSFPASDSPPFWARRRSENEVGNRKPPMPAVFIGHGNPLNALAGNTYSRGWRALADSMPAPRAIVSVSAHWYVPFTAVTAMERPRTIHDFGGFPRALYEVQYPAPGDPSLAARVAELLKPTEVHLDDRSWGLDHGTWAVLCHMYPKADVAVIQLSIAETEPAAFHYELGQRLGSLRDEGVLIVGSGNIVHNLHAYAWGAEPREPYDWAVRFETEARRPRRSNGSNRRRRPVR